MAVIGRIRKRVGLLIGFVGVSMLLFILGDLVTSNTGLLHRNSDVIGEINGEKIRYQEFQKRVEKFTENYKNNTRNENVDANTMDMLRDQAWQQYVNDLTLGKEYEALGISCSDEELFDMCTGSNPHEQIKKAFSDPKTGIFDPKQVVKFLKDLPNRDEKIQVQWKEFENALREERIGNKYKDLIKNSLFVTTEEAKRNYNETQRNASIHFARLDVNVIADSTIKVEDSDLSAYYNANSDKYKQAENIRKIEYVVFEVNPSDDDKATVEKYINDRRAEFESTTDNLAFVSSNSDSPFDSTYHSKGTLAPVLDSVAFKSPIGTIIGPYLDGNDYKLSKITAEKFSSDSVKARHILIKIANNDTAKAMAKVDSLKNAIKKGSKFDELATKFSEDQGSAVKGGDLGWFTEGTMVPVFNNACFNGKKGDMPVVTSEFGVHLIEIMDKTAPAKRVQIATLDRKIEPSQRTYDFVYGKANEFAVNNTTAESFDSSIVKQGLNKRTADNIRETDKNIAGLDQPRELIRWIYSAKKDEISKIMTFGDKYVIAHLVSVKNKGTLPLEDVKDLVTSEVRRQKKLDMLVEKFKAAGSGNVDAIASKLNITPTDADNVNFTGTFIAGMGNEPYIVGAIFALKAGQTSSPIKGENSVVVVNVKSFTEPPATKDFSANQKQLRDQLGARSTYEIPNTLKEQAGIEDNRGKFF
ncbi:MAG: SurA N-terminal domain-containing protein [Bacteroidia bacterium]